MAPKRKAAETASAKGKKVKAEPVKKEEKEEQDDVAKEGVAGEESDAPPAGDSDSKDIVIEAW